MPGVAVPGLEVSLGKFLQHRLVQAQVSDQLLQLGVLLLQLFEALHLWAFHTAESISPSVVRLLGDTDLLGHIRDGSACRKHGICFTQLRDDLFRGMTFSLHGDSLAHWAGCLA